MHLTLPILLSLLSSTAYALPTNTTLPTPSQNTTTTIALTKRTKPGWIGSFPSNSCAGPVAPNVHSNIDLDTCYKFSPWMKMAWIGVNYGSGDDQNSMVSFFVDDACKYVIGGPQGAGYVAQGKGGSGMRCTNELGMTKSFKIDSGLQSFY